MLAILLQANTYDTIHHTIGRCLSGEYTEEDEELHFSFNEDTLVFSGRIQANACGSHFLVHAINVYNAIIPELSFWRLDTGQLCEDYCLFNFQVKLPNCNHQNHHLI